MINPNALPTSPTVQDFQNFGDNLNSTDYNDTLNAMRYMQGQRTGGLNRLPQVTVPMQEGGMMEEAMMEQQAPMNPEEAMMMQQQSQGNEQIKDIAQELATYGREGDNLLVHMNPQELKGLMSLGEITYNPITGLPEAFSLKKLFSAPRAIFKGAKRVAKSKAFKTIAPIALAIAAPYALGALAPSVFGSAALGGGTAFGGLLASGTVGGAAVTAGLGSLAGNLLAGRKFGDAAKAALITGATAGLTRGIGNKMAGKSFMGTTQPLPPGAGESVGAPGFQGGFEGPQPSPFGGGTSSYTGVDTQGLGQFAGTKDAIMEQGLTKGGVDLGTGSYGDAVKLTGPVQTSPAVEQAITSSYTQPMNVAQANIQPQQVPTLDAMQSQQALQAAQAQAPVEQTFASRLGDAKDAVIKGFKDRYTFDKAGLMNLGKDVLTADVGQSALELEQQQQQALEDQQLADAGYSVSYPSGFGTQRVIRDSSGVVVNATAQDILARALGGGRMQFAPKTTFAQVGSDFQGASPEKIGQTIGGALGFAKEGGLIELAQGGEFSGMVPGQGGGMDDNVYMPIKEGPKQVGTLAVSPTEYVVDSYTMAALGDGNPDEGAKVMDRTIKQIRKKAYGTTEQPNEIDGLAALKPMAQGV
jgi:hypothetical protein